MSIKTDIAPLKLQMFIKTIKKCTFHMPHNSSQMNHIEKSVWGYRALYILQKTIGGAFQ